MTQNNSKSYQSMLKGTAIFGSVQIFNVLINIIRGKLIAIIMGTVGMGVSSLYNSAIMPIQQLASMGLNQSSVRLISMAKEGTTNYPIETITSVYNLLIRFSALIGFFTTLIFSYQLAIWTFGNSDNTYWFMIVGVVIGIQILSSGNITYLQGLREYKKIASCSIIAPTCGLIIGIPLYYLYGIDGIVPAMLILAVTSYSYSSYCKKKCNVTTKKVSSVEIWTIGKDIILMGLVMMIASLLGQMTTYFINLYIRSWGSVSDVGLFQAANSITNQYSGLIFAAMAADFYPRLSAVSKDTRKVNELVNEQTEIVMLLIMPIAGLIIITAPLLIRILLTEEFLPISHLIKLMGFSLIFKAIAYPIGYISFSHGDKKYFFCVEGLWINLKTLLLFICFFYLWGLIGLGYAAIISGIIDIFVAILLNKWRYNFNYNKSVFMLSCKLLPMSAIILLIAIIGNDKIYTWPILIFIYIFMTWYSYQQLNKRVDVFNIIKAKFNRKDIK